MSWHATPHDLDLYARGALGDSSAASLEAAPHELRLLPGHGRRSRRPFARSAGSRRPSTSGSTSHRDPGGSAAWAGSGCSESTTRLLAASARLQGSWVAAGLVAVAFSLSAAVDELQPDLAGGLPRPGPRRAAPRRGHGLRPPGRPGLRDRGGLARGRRTARPGAVGRRDRRVGPDHGGALVPAPRANTLAFAWLLPALGLAAVSLALGSWVSVTRAAVVLAAVWGGAAVVALSGAPRTSADAFARGFVAFRPAGQLAFALATLVAGAVVLARRSTTMEVLR